MRKPRPFKVRGFDVAWIIRFKDGWHVEMAHDFFRFMSFDSWLSAKLGAWLLKAAEWIRSREGK